MTITLYPQPLGRGLLGQERFGDQGSTATIPRPNALGVTYTISLSGNWSPLQVTYTVQAANVAPLLVYYLITPPSRFAINGDGSIVRPDQVAYIPRPVASRSLVGGPFLQGYKTMSWTWTTLQVAEFNKLIGFYNPQSPIVQITYPDETGTWVQRQAVMLPPQYGTQSTISVSDVVFTFSRLF